MQLFFTVFKQTFTGLDEQSIGKRFQDVAVQYDTRKETLSKILNQIKGSVAPTVGEHCCQLFSCCDRLVQESGEVSSELYDLLQRTQRCITDVLHPSNKAPVPEEPVQRHEVSELMNDRAVRKSIMWAAQGVLDLSKHVVRIEVAARLINDILAGEFGERIRALLFENDSAIVEQTAFLKLMIWYSVTNKDQQLLIHLSDEERAKLSSDLVQISRQHVIDIYLDKDGSATWPKNPLFDTVVQQLFLERDEYAALSKLLSVKYSPPLSAVLTGALLLALSGESQKGSQLLFVPAEDILKKELFRTCVIETAEVVRESGIVEGFEKLIQIFSVHGGEFTKIMTPYLEDDEEDAKAEALSMILLRALARDFNSRSVDEIVGFLHVVENRFTVESETALRLLSIIVRYMASSDNNSLVKFIEALNPNYEQETIISSFKRIIAQVLFSDSMDSQRFFLILEHFKRKWERVDWQGKLFSKEMVKTCMENVPDALLKLMQSLADNDEGHAMLSNILVAILQEDEVPREFLEKMRQETFVTIPFLQYLDLDKKQCPKDIYDRIFAIFPQKTIKTDVLKLYEKNAGILAASLKEQLFDERILSLLSDEGKQDYVGTGISLLLAMEVLDGLHESEIIEKSLTLKKLKEKFLEDGNLGEPFVRSYFPKEFSIEGISRKALDQMLWFVVQELLDNPSPPRSDVEKILQCFLQTSDSASGLKLVHPILVRFVDFPDLGELYGSKISQHIEFLLSAHQEADKRLESLLSIPTPFNVDFFFSCIPESYQSDLFRCQWREEGSSDLNVDFVEEMMWRALDNRILNLLEKTHERDRYVIEAITALILLDEDISPLGWLEEIEDLSIPTKLKDAAYIALLLRTDENDVFEQYMDRISHDEIKRDMRRLQGSRSEVVVDDRDFDQRLNQGNIKEAMALVHHSESIIVQHRRGLRILAQLLTDEKFREQLSAQEVHKFLEDQAPLLKTDFALYFSDIFFDIDQRSKRISLEAFFTFVPEAFHRSFMKMLTHGSLLDLCRKSFGNSLYEDRVLVLLDENVRNKIIKI